MSASVAPRRLTVRESASLAHAIEAPAPKRELRVLQVFSVLSVGGAEAWLMALLRYFREAEGRLPVKVRCDILLTGGQPSVFDEEAKTLGAQLFYVPFSRSHPIKFMREFRRILADGNYDVIHDHQDYIAGLHFAMGLGRLPRIRVAHVHNPFFCVRAKLKHLRGRITVAACKRLLSRFATAVLGTSGEILSKYGFNQELFDSTNVSPVHCGFDVSRFSGRYAEHHAALCREFGWDDSARIVLFVGRLDTPFENTLNQKNPLFALQVARSCIARDARVRMLIAGGGEEVGAALELQLRQYRLTQQVRLLGVRHDVPRLMIGSELLLFPSLDEGLGMVAVEAQAAGLNVLASDVVPRECVVIPGLVHFYPLHASAFDWATEALRLLNLKKRDPAECNRAIQASPFSIENSAKALINFYGGIRS